MEVRTRLIDLLTVKITAQRQLFFYRTVILIMTFKKTVDFQRKRAYNTIIKNKNSIQKGACTVKNHWLQDNREKGENPLRSRHCVGEAGLFYVTGKPGRQAVPMNLSQETCLFCK